MKWFSADHHFWHKAVIDYCNRPFADVDEMNGELIRRWNILVSPSDEVFYCGDFSMGNATQIKQILPQLNGRKYLIRGNHDKGRSDTWWKREGFAAVHREAIIEVSGVHCVLSHYPYRGYKHDEREFLDMVTDRGLWLIHGHVHNSWKQQGRMINVGVDQWAYAPVSEQEIASLIKQEAP